MCIPSPYIDGLRTLVAETVNVAPGFSAALMSPSNDVIIIKVENVPVATA